MMQRLLRINTLHHTCVSAKQTFLSVQHSYVSHTRNLKYLSSQATYTARVMVRSSIGRYIGITGKHHFHGGG